MNAQFNIWFLLIQEFNITILDRPMRENLVADFLSRLIHIGNNALVDDNFPDENLFFYLYLRSLVCRCIQFSSNKKITSKFVHVSEAKNYTIKCQLHVA